MSAAESIMRACPPSQFASRWPGALRPIQIPDPPLAFPADCIRLLAEFGLPRKLTICCYNDITLNFNDSLIPLAEIWERDQKCGYQIGAMPQEWKRFCHVADQAYVQGGGWVCLEETTGRLVVIDLDQAEPVYLLNSSIQSFYTTLNHLLDWSEKAAGTPEETVILRDELLSQDCVPSEELEDFWLNFVNATLDGHRINLSIRLDRKDA